MRQDERPGGEIAIRPTEDRVFKSILLSNPLALIIIIANLLGVRPNLDKREIAYENKELIPPRPVDEKTSILDLIIKYLDIISLIEMQTTTEKNLFKRLRSYFCAASVHYLEKGQDYLGIQKIMVLGLLTEPFFKNEGYLVKLYPEFNLQNSAIIDFYTINIIQLSKLPLISEDRTDFELILLFIAATTWEQIYEIESIWDNKFSGMDQKGAIMEALVNDLITINKSRPSLEERLDEIINNSGKRELAPQLKAKDEEVKAQLKAKDEELKAQLKAKDEEFKAQLKALKAQQMATDVVLAELKVLLTQLVTSSKI